MNEFHPNRRKLLLSAAALGLHPLAARAAQAPYPSLKPVRLIVPFAAGGSSDVVGRTIGEWMAKDLQQTVLIENKAGAAGAIGSDFVARAEPDGYTLLLVDANHMTNPVFTRNIPFDPVKDFTAVGGIAKTPLFLVCRPDFPATSIAGMLDHAHKHPGKLNIGIPGNGSIVFEMIRHLGKATVTVVPYKGTAPALVDLVAGQLDLMVISIASGASFVKNGQVRMLANTAPVRHPDYPDVPTFAEAGLPGVEYEQWFGILGPAGLPAPVSARISRSIGHALAQPPMKERLRALALDPYEADAEAFRARVEDDARRWKKLAKEAHIRPVG
ncbi:tripartite-type tricarboxylate transporter receptor subunit TctC [Variovorax sp. TBS-050B]|uniref:Bug family tripartite tricarboxylate transporter substrate binding protein n=1 Tax=Variovorax sp. TBS-050B TaxID=2940551 RepID=UPI002476127A|nr:tripartite tricarboxylate transporter substrate binding protein [Variovorax sp. TBS-050B]MDH6593842.1 tripartite-type tricarboxylate transporter receptor subunit TctC [Variovorax sp. TBS-050B]